MPTFAIPFGKFAEFWRKPRAMKVSYIAEAQSKKPKIPKEFAEIAQLVEHNLAKVGVASSSLVFRSKTGHLRMTFIMAIDEVAEP